jgi:hypothetical protein
MNTRRTFFTYCSTELLIVKLVPWWTSELRMNIEENRWKGPHWTVSSSLTIHLHLSTRVLKDSNHSFLYIDRGISIRPAIGSPTFHLFSLFSVVITPQGNPSDSNNSFLYIDRGISIRPATGSPTFHRFSLFSVVVTPQGNPSYFGDMRLEQGSWEGYLYPRRRR